MNEELYKILDELGATTVIYVSYKEIYIIDSEEYMYCGKTYDICKRRKLPHKLRQNPFAIYNIKQYLKNCDSNLELLSTEYVDVKSNLEYRCKIHNDKTQFHSTSFIFDTGGNCKFCSREEETRKSLVSEEDIIKRCKELDLIFVERYVKNGSRIKFICPHHKDKGIQDMAWYHLRTATYGCKYCAGKNKTTEDFKRQIAMKNPDVEILNEYTGSATENRIMCRCKICGYEWDTSPASLRNGSGCPECGRKKKGLARRVTQDEFEEKLHIAQPNLILEEPYKGSHVKTKFRCLKHDRVFESYPANILNNSAHCPTCTNESAYSGPSKGEKRISSYLNDHHIPFLDEHTFDDCKNTKLLPFDFYLQERNLIIEYDGEQHYMPIDFFGGEKQYLRRKENDNIKNAYCKKRGINVIRIPYWEYDNIEAILDEELK